MSSRSPLPDWYDDLPGSLQAAWGALTCGALDRRSAFHLPVVATIGLDGRPRQRVMVLRSVDPDRRILRVNTDRRSMKAEELRADPRVSMLGYDPAAKIQIRLEGRAQLHHGDPIAEAAWAQSKAMSRVCYATLPAPGSPIAEGADFRLPLSSDAEALAGAQENFMTILVTIESLEWLYLAYEGHRRARFRWDARDALDACWLAP